MVQVKGLQEGLKGSFRIPIQACEKIESSESEEKLNNNSKALHTEKAVYEKKVAKDDPL